MFWCLYFRYFIKSTIFFEIWKFHQKLNFVSTPWKIIISLGNSVGGSYMGHTNPSAWIMIFFFYTKVTILQPYLYKKDTLDYYCITSGIQGDLNMP